MKKVNEKFMRFAADRDKVSRVLVIRNGLIGDTIFMLPVLDRLRAAFPHARLDMAASGKSLPVLQNNPNIDGVHVIPARFSVLAHSRFFLSLRKYRYDVAVVQESNSHYTLMAKLTGARYIAGFDNKLRGILDYAVPWPPNVHAVVAELETVRDWTEPVEPVVPRVSVTKGEVEEAAEILRSSGVTQFDRLICIHPGCSGKESKREWVPEYYSKVSDLLIEKNRAQVVIDGIGQDSELIDKIISGMHHKAVSLLGKTSIRQFLGLMKLSKLLVGPDTGTVHLATAVGTPVLMVIGPSDPVDTGPYDPTGRSSMLRADLPCAGCFRLNPRPAQWDICKDLYPVVCMQRLTPEKVYSGVIETLGW